MSLPISFLRPSTLKVLEKLPSQSKHLIIKRRSLSAFATPRSHRAALSIPLYQRRWYSPASDKGSELGTGQDRLPHVSEEAAQTAEIMGEEPVNIDEVGTPVEEVLKRDGGSENAPEVIKEEMKQGGTASSSQNVSSPSFSSTSLTSPTSTLLPSHIPLTTPSHSIPAYTPPIPPLPIPASHSINHRHHPLLRQLTPHFMYDGKLARAQSTIQEILRILRTKPAPRVGKHPLIPNSPDLSLLPTDPVAYLQTAIDSVAPLFKMRSTKGSGGSTVQIPAPLPVKARRRKAMEWMMAAADGKKRMKSLPERFAEEVEAVVLGTSSCWEKRIAVHKLAVTNRANVGATAVRKNRK